MCNIYLERAEKALKIAKEGGCKVGRTEVDKADTMKRLEKIVSDEKNELTGK